MSEELNVSTCNVCGEYELRIVECPYRQCSSTETNLYRIDEITDIVDSIYDVYMTGHMIRVYEPSDRKKS